MSVRGVNLSHVIIYGWLRLKYLKKSHDFVLILVFHNLIS